VFSEKRASTRIKSMLCVARDHAEAYKNLNRSKLIVAEAWVSKGEKLRRLDIKGRGALESSIIPRLSSLSSSRRVRLFERRSSPSGHTR